jgi:hypothetical protein
MWKNIPGFDYKINEYGQIKNKFGKILKPKIVNYSGISLHLGNKKYYQCSNIGRLVLMAFIGIEEVKECNHKDGNKLNNHISNLEWVTKSENCKHRDRLGLRVRAIKNHSTESKLKMRKSRLNNEHLYKRNKLGQYENTMRN